jgi:transposase
VGRLAAVAARPGPVGPAASVSSAGPVDGVRHRTRVGCPWRDVPARYGPWWRVYALFACWQVLGVWERIEAALVATADARRSLAWRVSIDSTTARAHIHAAGARRDGCDRVAGEPDHHALGRSRGGFSTKVHLAVEQHRGVLSFLLTPGQAGDSPEMIAVLEGIAVARPGAGRPRARPVRVLADKAYSSRANRAYLARRGIAATIPIPADQAAHRRRRGRAGGRPPAFDPSPTATGRPSNAGSTTTNTTAPWPPDTTSSPSATRPPSTSPSSTTGYDDFRNRS